MEESINLNWEQRPCNKTLAWIVEFSRQLYVLHETFRDTFHVPNQILDDLLKCLKNYPSEHQNKTLKSLITKCPELSEGKLPILPSYVLSPILFMLPPTDESFALLSNIREQMAEAERQKQAREALEKAKNERRTNKVFDVVFNPPKLKIVRIQALDGEEAANMALDIFQTGLTINSPDRRRRTVYGWKRHEGVVPLKAGRRAKR